MLNLWRAAAVLAAAVLAAACGSAAGNGGSAAGNGGAADPGSGVVPFAQFVRGLEAARYADYAGRPGVAVRGEQAFEQMRDYLLHRYRGAHVVASYASGGAVFDCLPRGAVSAPPSAPASPPAGATTRGATAPAATAGAAPARQARHGCPPGAIPVRRVTLDDLVRFADLRSFLAKGPGGGGVVLPPPG